MGSKLTSTAKQAMKLKINQSTAVEIKLGHIV